MIYNPCFDNPVVTPGVTPGTAPGELSFEITRTSAGNFSLIKSSIETV